MSKTDAQNSEKTGKKVFGRPFEKNDPRINRGGRPKGSPVSDILRRIFADNPEVIYNQLLGVMKGKSAIAKVMLMEKGAERLEGKVTQPVDVDVNMNLADLFTRLDELKAKFDGSESSDTD